MSKHELNEFMLWCRLRGIIEVTTRFNPEGALTTITITLKSNYAGEDSFIHAEVETYPLRLSYWKTSTTKAFTDEILSENCPFKILKNFPPIRDYQPPS